MKVSSSLNTTLARAALPLNTTKLLHKASRVNFQPAQQVHNNSTSNPCLCDQGGAGQMSAEALHPAWRIILHPQELLEIDRLPSPMQISCLNAVPQQSRCCVCIVAMGQDLANVKVANTGWLCKYTVDASRSTILHLLV